MDLINYIISMSLVGSIIYIMFLCLEQLTKHFFKASWHYNVLKFILLFFAVPLGNLGNLYAQKYQMDLQTGQREVLMQYIYINADNAIDNTGIRYGIITIWITGMVIIFGWELLCYLRFRYVMINSRRNAGVNLYYIADGYAKEQKIKRRVKLYVNEYMHTPMQIGFINPVILLPNAGMKLTNAKYILSHELTHYKQKDTIIKLIVLLIRIVHWFNPFIYLFSKEMNKWCEYACDEKSTANLSHEMKKMYGLAILEAAVSMPICNTAFGAPLLLPKQNLKKRLLFMLNVKEVRKREIFISLVITIAFINAAVLFASTTENLNNRNWVDNNSAFQINHSNSERETSTISSKLLKSDLYYKATVK